MCYSHGRFSIPNYFDHEKNGVHHLMLEEFVLMKIEKVDKRLSKSLEDTSVHIRKDMNREIGKLKKDLEDLTHMVKQILNAKLTRKKKCA